VFLLKFENGVKVVSIDSNSIVFLNKKMDRFSFLSLFLILLVPFLLFFYCWRIKRKNKERIANPKPLYHFIENKESFVDIINSKTLLSLAGGRVHTTSRYNPSLGKNSGKNKKEYFVLIIKQNDDLRKFRPITFGWDILQIWKWWKSFRDEYVYTNLKDINFDVCNDSIIREDTECNGEDCIVYKAYINNVRPLENTECVHFIQKWSFFSGEIILSLSIFLVWICVVEGYLFFLLDELLPISLLGFISKCFASYGVQIFSMLLWLVLFVICLHGFLRQEVIRSRNLDYYFKRLDMESFKKLYLVSLRNKLGAILSKVKFFYGTCTQRDKK